MASFTFLIGLLIGFWGQYVVKQLQLLHKTMEERKTYEEAGVVRPTVRHIPQVDLTSPSGGVRRPTPDEYMLANIKERDARLKNM